MWQSWKHRQRRRITFAGEEDAGESSSRPSFNLHTLKDIQFLFSEENKNPVLSVFHRVRIATSALRTWRALTSSSSSSSLDEKRIVVYMTSLHVVRKTFEDCKTVISILKGLRVVVDMRDLSMDSRFLNELTGILRKKQPTLPRVFIGGRYMGGAEEIQQLNETGELKKFIQGVPMVDTKSGMCGSCAGVTFVLCDNCSGSRKFFAEKSNCFRSCTLCNENGLLRCPDCYCLY